MNIERLVRRTAVVVALLCLVGVAKAQTAWDTNVLTWTNPTTCSTGEPITQCPITQIRVEEAPTATGTFKVVTTLATVAATYTHTGVAAGQHCYRVVVGSAKGDSAPSNVYCKTNTKPVGPPNPATNLQVVESTAWNIQMKGHDVVLAQVIGKAKLGARCGNQCFDGYCPVARSNIRLSTNQPAGAVMVAKCG